MTMVVPSEKTNSSIKGKFWAALKICSSFKMRKAMLGLKEMKKDKKAE